MVLRFRGGGTAEAPTFGPLAGPQSVRDAATCGAVGVFSGAPGTDFTQLNPANSSATNQAAINNDTTGQIWWPLGTYVAPTGGFQARHGQDHHLECPSGRIRSAANSAVIAGTNYGIQTQGGTGAAISIRGGVFSGATLYGIVVNDPATTIEDTICETNTVGLLIQYSTTVRRSIFRDNTSKGLGAGLSWQALVLENLEFDNNNTSHTDPANDASGCKILLPVEDVAASLTARFIWAHDNYGRGFWCDTMLVGTATIEENVCEDNSWNGLMYEASTGTASIRRNWVAGNCWETGVPAGNWNRMSQVLISRSDGLDGGGGGIDVEFNYLDGTGDTAPLALIHNGVPANPQSNATHVTQNDMWFRSTFGERVGGKHGPSTTVGTSTLFNTGNNTFEGNSYHAPNTTASYFTWGSPGGAATNMDFTTWKTFDGHDDTGTLVLI